ncbi:MAG: YopX family protein [Nitrosopumilaceae archaeon]|jgi:uncharacterized phage protein (TIGR01671 family)
MSTLKCKAWNKKTKKMFRGGPADLLMDFRDSKIYEFDFENNDWNETNDYEILQYTGLKDKNGKKIYEGDIILTQTYSTRPYSVNAKFKRFKAVVELVIDTTCDVSEYRAIIKEKMENYRYSSFGDFFDCEVIGNIYENPELLKEEK